MIAKDQRYLIHRSTISLTIGHNRHDRFEYQTMRKPEILRERRDNVETGLRIWCVQNVSDERVCLFFAQRLQSHQGVDFPTSEKRSSSQPPCEFAYKEEFFRLEYLLPANNARSDALWQSPNILNYCNC